MAKIHKVILPAGEWVDINTETSIAVGTALTIQNVSTVWTNVTESDTTPDESTPFKTLTSLTYPSAEGQVLSGALKVWAKSTSDSRNSVIAVQEV